MIHVRIVPLDLDLEDRPTMNLVHDPGIVPAGHPGRCGALGGLVGLPTAHRGQPRGQKGRNRFAPALTGANSREASGADTEIRTQDLLFTKQLLYR